MQLLDYVAMSKSRYTDQFDEDPVFDALVQTLIEYKMKTQEDLINFADIFLDIDKSSGRNLDIIGDIVGQSRVLIDYYSRKYFGFQGNPRAEPFDKGMWYSLFSDSGGDSRTLSDEEYRRVIKARIIRNKTNCTRRDFMRVLDLLMGITRDHTGQNIFINSLYDKGNEPFPSEFNVMSTKVKNPKYKHDCTKVTYTPTASGTFDYIGVKSAFEYWNLKLDSKKKYTFVCKAASSTGRLDHVTLYSNSGVNNQTLDIKTPISTDEFELTQVVFTFETWIDTNVGDVLIGINSDSLNDWLVFTDMMLIEGESTETVWKPSIHSQPTYEIKIPSHGNIDLKAWGAGSDNLAVHFLSNLERIDNLVPVSMAYRLMVEIVD